jgi:ABC-2 type transport system permease protein
MSQFFFNLSIYGRLIAIQIRSQMQYRVAFALDVLATFITMLLFFVSLALVFERFGDVAGWTLGEVAFLWGLVEMGFGLMDLVFGGFDPGTFGQRVRRGQFDQLLLRPIQITLQVLGDRFILRRLGRIVQGVAIFVVALRLADIQWTPEKLLYLPLVILGLFGFFGGLFVIGSTITFWTVDSIEVMNILTYGGSEMMHYAVFLPMSCLPFS